MLILLQSALFSPTPPPVPVLLLPAPPRRLALPAPRESAPKIAGYLPAPQPFALPVMRPVRKVVFADAFIKPPHIDINIYKDPDGFWAEFERIFGPDKSIEEMDAELEAKHPGYLAWVARRKAGQL